MIPIAVETFAQIVGGEPHGFASGVAVCGFATDNRDVKPGDLFLAIKGARVDGHDFVADAMARGAVGALAEWPVDGPYILVANLIEALANLGRHYRAQFKGPVVGVTGSAGKTTAKEFIAAALSRLGPILKTPGNRNTEYTSPLIWTDLVAQTSSLPSADSGRLEACATRAVVVEMSMRGFGQIRHLAEISQPTIGVVTNVGYSHMSEVGSREGIAQAKAELLESLPTDGVAVLWQEDPYLHTLRAKSPAKVVTFGYSEEADCRITGYHATSWTSCRIGGHCAGEPFEAILPAVGRHIALGAAAAIAVAGSAGVPPAQAALALAKAEIPHMRMEVVDFHGAKLLLDTYNAAPPSMLAAIETFTELPCEGKRFAVIGEMRELGPYSEEAHRELGRVLASSGIDEAIFYHGEAALSAEEARMHGMVVHEAHSLGDIAEFLGRALPGDGVLVKGSRSLELERAVEMAEERAGTGRP
ncbi:MAG TPA: UDP-N-acetylmuramoyl-tripeptide--D-alanyl-D-alanine ligase [Fimbriimonadaceae bacterium]|nr:UDP-N-acetylmuramoyl-tripeptide--D-alanyl-D-alanine ligase [Fimbriimonadaceae bacterium]